MFPGSDTLIYTLIISWISTGFGKEANGIYFLSLLPLYLSKISTLEAAWLGRCKQVFWALICLSPLSPMQRVYLSEAQTSGTG